MDTPRRSTDLTDPAVVHAAAVRSMSRAVTETAEPTAPGEALDRAAELLRGGDVAVLTGAGVSTDSGIPDYRGPNGSLSRHRPMTYQEFRHDPAAVRRYWARSFIGWRRMADAEPNRTHFALVELERAGRVRGVVTQNVDGLHAAAGQQRLIALHGELGRVVCLDCGHELRRDELDARFAAANPGLLAAVAGRTLQVNPDGDVDLPDQLVRRFTMVGCPACGSARLKPDVVYFGESVPAARRAAAISAVTGSRGLLVAGSSLAVMSGYRLVIEAQRAGLPVVVVNGGPGRADARADVVWRTPVGPAFDALLDELGL